MLVFLEKVHSTSTNQNFIICCWYFSCCLFVPCDIIVVICLSNDDGLIFFCFWFGGALGLLLCLKSKKHKGSDLLANLMGNYHKSYLHAYLSEFLGEWLEVWTWRLIKYDAINGRFININSLLKQPVDYRISKTESVLLQSAFEPSWRFSFFTLGKVLWK